MRAGIATVPTPHPVLPTLPGIYQEPPAEVVALEGPPFLARFCGALDEVLVPVVSTMDNFAAYLDVDTAPTDFLPWLAYWLGMPVGAGPSLAAQRRGLHAAGSEQAWQGTARGIALVVEAVTGSAATVEEPGGVTWSQGPDLPQTETSTQGQTQARSLVVWVRASAESALDRDRLDSLVASLKPAHVPHRVEIRQE